MNALWRALASLTEKERLVLALRFRHEKTPDEIGRALGETLARVRGLEASALGKLHERLAPRRFVPRELFPRCTRTATSPSSSTASTAGSISPPSWPASFGPPQSPPRSRGRSCAVLRNVANQVSP